MELNEQMLKTLIAICVSAVVLGAFLFLNADGHPVYLVRAPLYSKNTNLPTFPGFEVNYSRVRRQNWIHGWPIAGLLRVGVLPVGYKGELLERVVRRPTARTSRWPFDNVPWYHTNYTAFAVNALIMTIVTTDAFLFSRRMLANRLRLTIPMLLTVLFIVAVVSSSRVILLVQLDWQERTAVIVVVFCILATAIRFILAFTRRILHRLKRPKQDTLSEMN